MIHSMRRLAVMASAFALAATACSGMDPTSPAATQSDGAPSPAPSFTTAGAPSLTTTTTPPFVSAYPDLSFELHDITGQTSTWVPSPRELEPDTGPVIEVSYEQGYFEPALLEITQPQLIRFTNGSDEPVTIAFDEGALEEFTIAASSAHTIDVASLPPGVHRYHTYVGRSKIPGTINTSALGDYVGTYGEPAPQWSFSGRLNVVLTERRSRWDVYPQYNGIVAVPRASSLNESFLRSIVLGDPLVESGLSIQLVDASPDHLLNELVPPAGCVLAGRGPTTRAGVSGTEQTYACESGELSFGVLDAADASLAYTLAQVPADSAPDLVAILDSARIEPANSGTPTFGVDATGPVQMQSLYYEGAWRVDIVDGTLGPQPAVGVVFGNSTIVQISNYDATAHVVFSVAGPLIELPPHTSAVLDLTDLAGTDSSAHFMLGDTDFGRMSVDFDLSGLAPLPPESAYADPTVPEIRLTENEFSVGIDATLVLQTLDIPGWDAEGTWTLRRNADSSDVTTLEQFLDLIGIYEGATSDQIVAEMAAESHRVPTNTDRIPISSALEWQIAEWKFDDRPSTAIGLLVADDVIFAKVTLVAAPEEFDLFAEELFLPAINSFRFAVKQ